MTTDTINNPPTCPNCRSSVVRRSKRRALWEQPLSWTGRFPFRCQICDHRFYGMDKPEKPDIILAIVLVFVVAGIVCLVAMAVVYVLGARPGSHRFMPFRKGPLRTGNDPPVCKGPEPIAW